MEVRGVIKMITVFDGEGCFLEPYGDWILHEKNKASGYVKK